MSGEHTHALPDHEHPHTHPDPAGHIVLFPTGDADDDQIATASEALHQRGGGLIELCAGTWDMRLPVELDDDIALCGHGNATLLRPSPDFPANQPLIRVYHDDKRPASGVTLRDFTIRGNPGNNAHGIDFCGVRGLLSDVRVERMGGDALSLRHCVGWTNHETKLRGLRLGYNAGYGIRSVDSADMQWTDCDVYSNALGNVYGRVTGCMITACHLYGGSDNPLKQQTVRNVHLFGSSRTRVTGGKIEHAAQELVYLEGDPKGGSVAFTGVGFRNGGGLHDDTYAQIRVTRTGGNFWRLNVTGCQFDADKSKPSWNVQIQEGAVRQSRITGCTLEHAVTGDVTPVTGLTVV